MPSSASTVEVKKPDLVQQKSARWSWPRRISVEVKVSDPELSVTSPFLSTPSKESYPQQKTAERKTSRHSFLPLTPVHSTVGKIELAGNADVPDAHMNDKSESSTPSPTLLERETTGLDPIPLSPVGGSGKIIGSDGPDASDIRADQDFPALQDSKSPIEPERADLASSIGTPVPKNTSTIDPDSNVGVPESLGQDSKDQEEPLSLGEHTTPSQISLHVYSTVSDMDSIVSADEADASTVLSTSKDRESQSSSALANTTSTDQSFESAPSVSSDRIDIESVNDVGTPNLLDHGRAGGTYGSSSSSLTLPKVQAKAGGPQLIESAQDNKNSESPPTEKPDQLRLLQVDVQVATPEEVDLRRNDTQPRSFHEDAKVSSHSMSETDLDENLYQQLQPRGDAGRGSHDATAEGDNDILRSRLELDGDNVQNPLPQGKRAFSIESGSNVEGSRPYRLERSQRTGRERPFVTSSSRNLSTSESSNSLKTTSAEKDSPLLNQTDQQPMLQLDNGPGGKARSKSLNPMSQKNSLLDNGLPTADEIVSSQQIQNFAGNNIESDITPQDLSGKAKEIPGPERTRSVDETNAATQSTPSLDLIIHLHRSKTTPHGKREFKEQPELVVPTHAEDEGPSTTVNGGKLRTPKIFIQRATGTSDSDVRIPLSKVSAFTERTMEEPRPLPVAPGKSQGRNQGLPAELLESKQNPLMIETGSDAEEPATPRIKRRKLYLRKARNAAARKVILNLTLGRQLADQTKPALRLLASGESLDFSSSSAV